MGKTTVKRLARDPAPAEIVHLKKEDIPRFRRLARQYGVLYFFVHKKGKDYGITNVVSNANYAPQLNAIMEELGYPIPEKAAGEPTVKKAPPRTPPERSSQERENGSKQRAGSSAERPSVKGRLNAFREAAQKLEPQLPTHTKTRQEESISQI